MYIYFIFLYGEVNIEYIILLNNKYLYIKKSNLTSHIYELNKKEIYY